MPEGRPRWVTEPPCRTVYRAAEASEIGGGFRVARHRQALPRRASLERQAAVRPPSTIDTAVPPWRVARARARSARIARGTCQPGHLPLVGSWPACVARPGSRDRCPLGGDPRWRGPRRGGWSGLAWLDHRERRFAVAYADPPPAAHACRPGRPAWIGWRANGRISSALGTSRRWASATCSSPRTCARANPMSRRSPPRMCAAKTGAATQTSGSLLAWRSNALPRPVVGTLIVPSPPGCVGVS